MFNIKLKLLLLLSSSLLLLGVTYGQVISGGQSVPTIGRFGPGEMFLLLAIMANYENNDLLHNKPCFLSNIAITNYFVSHTCKIRFHDVIGCTGRMFSL